MQPTKAKWSHPILGTLPSAMVQQQQTSSYQPVWQETQIKRARSPCLLFSFGFSLLFVGALVSVHVSGNTPSVDQIRSTLGSALPWIQCSHVASMPDPLLFDRKFRVLHHIDFQTHDSVMDRWYQRSHAGFESRTDLIDTAILWGPGFPDYQNNVSLVRNIARQFGSEDYFDAAFAYYNPDQVQYTDFQIEPFYKNIRELSQTGTIIIARPHEMRDCRVCDMIDNTNTSLVLCPYANECFDYKKKYERHVLLAHQPHAVHPALFRHPIADKKGGPHKRPIDVLLAGCQEPQLYPLRDRLRWMITDKVLKGEIYQHPGYPDTFTTQEKKKWNVRETTMNQQLKDFSRELGQAKICLVTSSRWGYAIQKYGEAAAAGCLIIGNLPLERQDDFREFVVPISMDMSDKEIVDTVNHYLVHDEERLEKTRKAQQYFLERFTGQRYVEDIVEWIKLAQRGHRGLVLPHQWRPLPDPLPWDG